MRGLLLDAHSSTEYTSWQKLPPNGCVIRFELRFTGTYQGDPARSKHVKRETPAAALRLPSRAPWSGQGHLLEISQRLSQVFSCWEKKAALGLLLVLGQPASQPKGGRVVLLVPDNCTTGTRAAKDRAHTGQLLGTIKKALGYCCLFVALGQAGRSRQTSISKKHPGLSF